MQNQELRRWLEDHLPDLMTECFSVTELAAWFNCGDDKMRTILRAIPGRQQHGRKYRLPVAVMPASYWLEIGLLRPISAD